MRFFKELSQNLYPFVLDILPKGFIGAGFYKTLPVCQLIFCVLTDDDRQIIFHLFPSASNGKLSLKSYQIPG